ncbi:MAG: Ig domain-containing protein [Gemmatimonadales bacterium]
MRNHPTRACLLGLGVLCLARAVQAQRVELSLTTIDHTPLVLAVGDTIRALATRYTCLASGDDCLGRDPRPVRAQWRSGDSTIATVTRDGLVTGKRPGRALLWATVAGREASGTVEVTPPATSLRWRYSPLRPAIGDTLRALVMLVGASGEVVGQIPPVVHIRGTGMTGDIISFDTDREAWLTIAAPGKIVLVGQLGHRRDTLRLVISPNR